MPINTALNKFRNPYNCAEAVYFAFNPENAEDASILDKSGSGRAPEGECGALFGTKMLTPKEKHHEIEARFAKKVGSTKCREIKRIHRTPCQQCVEKGAILAAAYRA